MRKFITHTSIFLALLLMGYWALVNIIPKEKGLYYGFALGYMRGIRFKYQRAQEITGPKIIFAGGSNLAYGLDSEMIEKKLSIPVVNMGLHAGLGAPFIIDQVKLVANPGDIVIFSIEYFMGDGDFRLRKQTCSLFPEYATIERYSIKEEVRTHLDETREGLKKYIGIASSQSNATERISSWEIREYLQPTTTYPFNQYGDFIEHLGQEGWYRRRPDDAKFQYRYWKGIAYLNEFKAEADAKGVNVFYSYAPFSKTAFERESKTVAKFHRDLSNDLDIELLNTPRDLVFEDHFLYDKEYHLTSEGRFIRTKELLGFLAQNVKARGCIAQTAGFDVFK